MGQVFKKMKEKMVALQMERRLKMQAAAAASK